MTRRFALFATLATLFFPVALPASAGVAPEAGPIAVPIAVVASFSILGDLVHEIGGNLVTCTTLVGPDGDVHVFEPSPDDARTIAAAQVVVINGLGLEGWISRLIQSSGYRGPVVVASEGATLLKGTGAARPGSVDPHAWQNIANVKGYVAHIGKGLATADPAHAATYRSNVATYAATLDTLDREVRTTLGAIPRERRKIITSHDAFGYFGAAYGLTLMAPVGFGTESEPSARAVGALIDQIRRDHIPAIFIENMSDPRLIQQIARESGARIGGKLFSDALSKQGGPADTYIDLVRHNTKLLVDSLDVSP